MAKEKVSVVFDRRKKAEQAGVGYVEVQIYLSRSERKYICLGKCTPEELDVFLSQPPVKEEIKRCYDCISAMSLFKDSMTISNFDIYYQGIKDGNGIQECRNSNLKTDFVAYMKDYIEKEHVSGRHAKAQILYFGGCQAFWQTENFRRPYFQEPCAV